MARKVGTAEEEVAEARREEVEGGGGRRTTKRRRRTRPTMPRRMKTLDRIFMIDEPRCRFTLQVHAAGSRCRFTLQVHAGSQSDANTKSVDPRRRGEGRR